jgi:hypothetical protein
MLSSDPTPNTFQLEPLPMDAIWREGESLFWVQKIFHTRRKRRKKNMLRQ